jgi:2-oxo-4-hydroxy-4-carboxy--5-ureidoimidazoline (OHCU) decarboxylase
MNRADFVSLLIGFGLTLAGAGVLVALFRVLTVSVEDEHVALVTRFGKLSQRLAARLERACAVIEEQGRLAVARLEADTAAQVATLVADVKAQYPLAVGAALQRLRARPQVHAAYTALFQLSQLRPHRTVAFRGFEPNAIRSADAAMLAPETATPQSTGR